MSLDLDKALNDAVLAFSASGSASGGVSEYVLDFRKINPHSSRKTYLGNSGKRDMIERMKNMILWIDDDVMNVDIMTKSVY